jgi:hypothetical protein
LQEAFHHHALQLLFGGGARPPFPLYLAFAGSGLRFSGSGIFVLLLYFILSGTL